MNTYLISVLGIVITSVIVEILIPSGETAKYIKSIIAIFVVYVLINPIILFLQRDFDIEKYLKEPNINVNESLLNTMYERQIEAKQTDLENLLFDDGFQNVEIKIVYEIEDNKLILKKAIVNLQNLVITNSNVNINKYQYIRQVIMSNIALKEEDIVFE